MAQIGWIDFSPTHRDKVGAALDLLTPEGMVDELGLGSLRDGMANHLFPGISTIQTRAKYFFIVPYILYDFQQIVNSGQGRGRSASKYLKEREDDIMWQLGDYYEHKANYGVIGIRKFKPRKLVRRPSAIYWNGINMYKFLDSGGLSAEVLFRNANKGEFESLLAAITNTDEAMDDKDAEHENLFKLRVRPHKNWQENLTLDLSNEEADFFFNSILTVAKGKLLSSLLQDNSVWDIYRSSSGFMEFSKAIQTKIKDDRIKEELILAHDFSELVYGAHITYNCLLQDAAFGNNFFDVEWEEWLNNLPSNMLAYDSLDLDRLISYTLHPKKTTVEFVKNWFHFITNDRTNIKLRNSLVENQEYNVKRGKARLRFKKFDDVKEERWIGLTYFNYRFGNVRTIINDIKTGLAE